MSYFISVREVYKVTIYSRAGASPNQPYNLYYSEDSVNWTLASGPLTSTTCDQRIIVDNGSGTIYLYAEDDSTNTSIYIRGANSTTCPANLDVTCTYSRSVTANSDVAITVYVSGSGDYRSCT